MPTEFKSNQKAFDEDLPERCKNNCIYRLFYYICTHAFFTSFITILILANTLILAMDRYPISLSELETNENLNNYLSWFFFGEMVIKLIGLGFKLYVKDKFNIFDCVIVMVSTIENVV
jgi:hypothetical protein